MKRLLLLIARLLNKLSVTLSDEQHLFPHFASQILRFSVSLGTSEPLSFLQELVWFCAYSLGPVGTEQSLEGCSCHSLPLYILVNSVVS